MCKLVRRRVVVIFRECNGYGREVSRRKRYRVLDSRQLCMDIHSDVDQKCAHVTFEAVEER